MTYAIRPNCGQNVFTDDLKMTRIQSSGFEKERNIVYHPDYREENESVCSGGSTGKEEICGDVVFFDGNEADFEAAEDEDELIERVWWLSKPPKIPKQSCVVSARRIQVMKERLSSTVKGLPSLGEALQKHARTRRRIKSDVEYVKVYSFDDTRLESCQTESSKIVPDCARILDELL